MGILYTLSKIAAKFSDVGVTIMGAILSTSVATIADRPLTCVSLTGGVSYYLPDTRSNVFNAKLHLIPAVWS